MGYQNQVLFGSDKSPANWSVIRKDICYAGLFRGHYFWDEPQKVAVKKDNDRYILALYRYCDTRLTAKDASEWMRFALYNMPPRVRKAISIRRAWGKYREQVRKFYDQGQPWLRVVIDGSKVSATEAYAILAFLRYPQERDDVVQEWINVQREYECNPSLAFLIAAALDGHSGHGIVANQIHGELKDKTPLQLSRVAKTYNIATCWKRLLRGQGSQEPYTKSTRKWDVAQFFVPILGMDWNGWADAEMGLRKIHKDLKSCATTQVWADRFRLVRKDVK